MPSVLELKYQKLDQFQNLIFISHKDDIDYDKLLGYYQKLKKMDIMTNLPIYYNEKYGYITIRFYKNNNFKPNEGYKYNVDFTVNKKMKNDKYYVNCYIKDMKFMSKPNEGEIIDLD